MEFYNDIDYRHPLDLLARLSSSDWPRQMGIYLAANVETRTVSAEAMVPSAHSWELNDFRKRGAVYLAKLPSDVDGKKLGAYIEEKLPIIGEVFADLSVDDDAEGERHYTIHEPEDFCDTAQQRLNEIAEGAPRHELVGFLKTRDYLEGDDSFPVAVETSNHEIREMALRMEMEAKENGVILWDDPEDHLIALRDMLRDEG